MNTGNSPIVVNNEMEKRLEEMVNQSVSNKSDFREDLASNLDFLDLSLLKTRLKTNSVNPKNCREVCEKLNPVSSKDWYLPVENKSVVQDILTKYVLVAYQDDDDHWQTLSKLLYANDEIIDKMYLFWACVKLLVDDHKTIRKNDLRRLLSGSRRKKLINLILLTLCKELEINFYTYEVSKSKSAIITEYCVVADEAYKSPYLFVGFVNNRLFPFIKHGKSSSIHPTDFSNARVQDVYGYPLRKERKEHILESLGLLLPGPKDYSLKDLLSEVQFIRRFDRRMIVAPKIALTNINQYMDLPKLADGHKERLEKFGCVKFCPATDEMKSKMSYTAVENSESLELDFEYQYLYQLVTNKIYILFNRTGKRESLNVVARRGNKLLRNIRKNPDRRSFIDNIVLAKQMSQPEYFYGYYEHKCPLISSWEFGENLIASRGNHLSRLHKNFSGINTPFYYLSGGNSFFGVHCEDQNLFSVNYILEGKYKKWIVIPRRFYGRFQEWVRNELEKKRLNMVCPAFLNHKTFIIDPAQIPKEFQLTYVCQRENEMVLVDTMAIHFGFNDGANLAVSFNFPGNEWAKFYQLQELCVPPPISPSVLKPVKEVTSSEDDVMLDDDVYDVTKLYYPASLQQLLDDALRPETCNFGLDVIGLLQWISCVKQPEEIAPSYINDLLSERRIFPLVSSEYDSDTEINYKDASKLSHRVEFD